MNDYLDVASEDRGSGQQGKKKGLRLAGFVISFVGFAILAIAFIMVLQDRGTVAFGVGGVGVVILLVGVAMSGAKVFSRKDRYSEYEED